MIICSVCEKEGVSRLFHVRASSLSVETHCEDGGWIQPGLNLFSFSDAINMNHFY